MYLCCMHGATIFCVTICKMALFVILDKECCKRIKYVFNTLQKSGNILNQMSKKLGKVLIFDFFLINRNNILKIS